MASTKMPVVKVPSPKNHVAAIQTVFAGSHCLDKNAMEGLGWNLNICVFGSPSCEILGKTISSSVTRISRPLKQATKHPKFRVGGVILTEVLSISRTAKDVRPPCLCRGVLKKPFTSTFQCCPKETPLAWHQGAVFPSHILASCWGCRLDGKARMGRYWCDLVTLCPGIGWLKKICVNFIHPTTPHPLQVAQKPQYQTL